MVIAFATSQAAVGSTLLGRVLPLARHLSTHHDVHVLGLSTPPPGLLPRVLWHEVGREPFVRAPAGKKRQAGLRLFLTQLSNALQTYRVLRKIAPDVVVLVKPLPANTLGVALYRWDHARVRVVLDADDFELTANVLSSLMQRAVVHAFERLAVKISSVIVVATPFLQDHFGALTNRLARVHFVLTGFSREDLPKMPVARLTKPTLLYLGSISINSGHRVDILPEIMERLVAEFPDIHLVMAGSGDDEEKLQREFATRKVDAHVTWHGRFTLEEVPDLLSQCHVLLDPVDSSIAVRAKSSFRAVLAAAYGKAVITSDIGIRPLLLPVALHRQFFAQAGNAAEYAAAVARLLRKPLTEAQQQELRDHAERFSWQKLAEEYEFILTNRI